MRYLSFLVYLALCVAVPAHAQDAPQAVEPTPALSQSALTEDIVTRFLASYPEVVEIAKSHDGDAIRATDTDRLMRSLGGLTDLTEAQDDLTETVKRHGFTVMAEWSSVGQSVVLAHSYAKSGRKPGERRSQMSDAIERIEKSPHVGEAEKKRFIELMQESMGFVGAIEPSQANIDLIDRMGDAVGAALDQ